MRLLPAGALLLAGCDLFFPLAEPTGEIIVPPETPTVSGRMTIRTTEMVGNAPELIDRPGETVALSVRFANGERINLAVQPDGMFTFERPTNDYVIEHTFEGKTRELHENTASVHIVLSFAGRFDAEPVEAPTVVRLPMPGQSVQVNAATIGQWSETVLNSTVPDLSWHVARPIGQRPLGLLSSDAGDALFVVQLADAAFGMAGQTAIRGVGRVDPFEMVNGVSFDFRDTTIVTPVPETGCLGFTAMLEATAGMRLEEAIANSVPAYNPPVRGWNIVAVPSRATGGLGGLTLVGSVVMTLDLDAVDARFHDPYPSHQRLFSIGLGATRSVQVGETSPTQVSTGTTLVFEADANGCATDAVFTADLPFVSQVRIDEGPIGENSSIPVDRTRGAAISWEVTPGTSGIDYFDVLLIEVRDAGGKTETETVYSVRTRRPLITLPESRLVSGHRYVLSIGTTFGLPGASMGDYSTIVYPAGSAVLASPMFVVE